jgi:DNA-binding LacI/PurR family transcriptional regulator
MSDVARRAGCDPSTVSLALRHDPRIAATTRERVVRAASELGYRTNPLIAAWVSARRASKPVHQHVSVAYLTCHPPSFRWKRDPHFRSIFEGAREQGERFGFSLEEFSLADYLPDLRRLNSVLMTRAVQGIIVGPGVESHSIAGLAWPH